MYNQQQVTQLDPLTQALITLKQGANLTTPKDNKLSVAGQAVQAMQPQQLQMPPQGIMGMAPQGGQSQSQGIMGAAQNAATGAAIQQMQEQEKQKALMQMAQRQQQAQQQQFMAAEGGLAMLPARNMGFKEGGIIPPGIRPPELPPEVESPEQREMAATRQQLLALQKNRPDFTAQLMSTLDADKQAREKIAAAQAANAPDVLSRLGELARNYSASGMRGVSEGVEQNKKAATTRMEAEREANRLDALERVKLQQADYAMKIGDLDKAKEFTKEAAGIRNQQNQLRQTEFGNRANIFGTQSRAEVDREQTAAANERNRATLAAQAEENKLNRGSQERIAGMKANSGNDETLKTELALYQLTMRQSGVDDLRTKIARMPNGLDGKPTPEKLALETQANTMESNIIKRFSNLSKYMNLDAGAGAGAGAGANPAGTGAPKKLVYNPKTGGFD
jgi:hypothetical protein